MYSTVVIINKNGCFLINTYRRQIATVVCIERQTPNLEVVGWIPGLGGYFLWGKNVLQLFILVDKSPGAYKNMLLLVMKQRLGIIINRRYLVK